MAIGSSVRGRSAVICATVIAGLCMSGCGSSVGFAVKAPVTAAAPVSTVTVRAPAAAATTVSVTATATVTGSKSDTVRGTVTETVTEDAGPDEASETSRSSPTGLKVGGPGVAATDDDGGATVAVVSIRRMTAGTGDYSTAPKNGNYLLVDVSYLCTTGKFGYDPFDWTVRDKDGRTFDSSGTYSSGYDDGSLHSGTIAKGGRARGTIVFDAPTGAVTLEYGDSYNQAPASWTIPA